MKPLVYWCRWHDARLRLHGRSDTAVWGELAFPDKVEPFRFDLKHHILTLGADADARELRLDEMGVELDDTHT